MRSAGRQRGEEVKPRIDSALSTFKRHAPKIDVQVCTFDYEDRVCVYKKPTMRAILSSKATPIVYVVSGESKTILKKDVAGNIPDDFEAAVEDLKNQGTTDTNGSWNGPTEPPTVEEVLEEERRKNAEVCEKEGEGS
jgi:hypothetical protein